MNPPTIVTTYTATIYVGLREGYSERIVDPKDALDWLQSFCDQGGCCVTVTNTEFRYKNGSEPGVIIGLINYPRFPMTPEKIREQAKTIASEFLARCKQQRVSIVYPDSTVMLEA